MFVDDVALVLADANGPQQLRRAFADRSGWPSGLAEGSADGWKAEAALATLRQLRPSSARSSSSFTRRRPGRDPACMARTKPPTGPRPGRPRTVSRAQAAYKASLMAPRQELPELMPSETEEESIFPEDEVVRQPGPFLTIRAQSLF